MFFHANRKILINFCFSIALFNVTLVSIVSHMTGFILFLSHRFKFNLRIFSNNNIAQSAHDLNTKYEVMLIKIYDILNS